MDAPLRPCPTPGCFELVKSGYCAACQARRPQRLYDAERGSSAKRGYDRRWRKFREGYLKRHPICEAYPLCDAPSAQPHHIQRLADGGARFDERNLQALCESHHAGLRGGGGRA
jgi:5-methylcytosine-specific restriction protein A